MLNLIATIVSIVLTLAVAGTGVYYGGTTFSASSGKVGAMNAIETMQQINMAWMAYAGDGGAAPTIGTALVPGTLLVNGTYLNSVPGTLGAVQTGAWVVDYKTTPAATETAEQGVIGYLTGSVASNGAAICAEIARSGGMIALGAAAPVLALDTPASFTTLFPSNIKYGCAAMTPATTLTANGIAVDGTTYMMFYRH
jgi:hypothetical protein